MFIPDPGSKRHRIWDPQHCEFYSLKKFTLFIYEGRPSYRGSYASKMKKERLFFKFCVFFTHLDPDPADQSHYGSMRTGSTTLE
jgi:hypothetical protein